MVKTKRLSDYKSGITIPDDYYTTGFVDGTNYSFPVSALYTYMWEGSATDLESLYTNVRQSSALNAQSSTIVSQSSAVFSTVITNSANWSYQGTDIKLLTGNWQTSHTYTNKASTVYIGALDNNTQLISAISGELDIYATNISAISANVGQIIMRNDRYGGIPEIYDAANTLTVTLNNIQFFNPTEGAGGAITIHGIGDKGILINSNATHIQGIPLSNPGPGIMWYDEGTSSFKMGT